MIKNSPMNVRSTKKLGQQMPYLAKATDVVLDSEGTIKQINLPIPSYVKYRAFSRLI